MYSEGEKKWLNIFISIHHNLYKILYGLWIKAQLVNRDKSQTDYLSLRINSYSPTDIKSMSYYTQ